MEGKAFLHPLDWRLRLEEAPWFPFYSHSTTTQIGVIFRRNSENSPSNQSA